jgi:hypothetical protein
MTSDEISRTIEFILQSQANAVVRMDETEKHLRKLDELSDTTSRQIRELAESTNRQIRELTTSSLRFQEDMKGFIKVVVPILEIQSKRLDRLEGLP